MIETSKDGTYEECASDFKIVIYPETEAPAAAGYTSVRTSLGRVAGHKAAMMAHLGRHLLPHENVHHKNGCRSDNRIENLELWNTSQPPGQRIDDKLKWARDLIDQYESVDYK